jgi:hypothetical protein
VIDKPFCIALIAESGIDADVTIGGRNRSGEGSLAGSTSTAGYKHLPCTSGTCDLLIARSIGDPCGSAMQGVSVA